MLLKDRKLHLISIFRCHDIIKNDLHSEIMSLPHSTTSLTSLKLLCFRVLTGIVQKMIYFNKRFPSLRAILNSYLHNMTKVFPCALL